MPETPARPRKLVTFLADEEANRFAEAANAQGLSIAAAIRRLILLSLREGVQG